MSTLTPAQQVLAIELTKKGLVPLYVCRKINIRFSHLPSLADAILVLFSSLADMGYPGLLYVFSLNFFCPSIPEFKLFSLYSRGRGK